MKGRPPAALTAAAIALAVGTLVGYGAATPAPAAAGSLVGAASARSAASLAPAGSAGMTASEVFAEAASSTGSVTPAGSESVAGSVSATPADAAAFAAVAASAASAASTLAASASGTSAAIEPPLSESQPAGLPRFNTSRGWTWSATWKPAGITGIALSAAAPHAGLVVHMDKSGSAYRLRARDARSGEDRWVSTPWQPPQPAPASGNGDEIAAVPRLVVVTHDGHDYIAVWTRGLHRPGDPGNTTDVFEVRLFPADQPGATPSRPVSPAHTVVQPVPNGVFPQPVEGSGPALLLTWERDTGTVRANIGIDAVTGRVSTYPDGSPTGRAVRAVTPDGPVFGGGPDGFELPGRWSSDQVAPAGADPRTGMLMRSVGPYLLATWRQADDPDDTEPPVWSVHDADTGKLLGSMVCGWGISDFDEGVPALSPDGRLVVLGSMGFDTATGKSHCLSGPAERRGVRLVSVGNDGWAFGQVYDPGEENPSASAAVSLMTPKPVVRAYLTGLRSPSDVFAGLGYFEAAVPRDPDVAVYPRNVSKGGRL
jgi:hypothetical protein